MSLATAIAGISPFGPIFGKELRTTARRKRTYFLRIVYLLLLLLVLLWVFLATSSMSRYNAGVAAQNQQRSELGQIFFACFGIFSVFIMGLLGPVMTATAISSERLHKTLPVLLMTPITAWQIVAGKLFSRLLVSLTLIGLGLPVLALVRLLGGVELEQVIGVIALALVAAISSAAIGLFFSTLLNRAYAVILLSFASMLFLYLFVPFVIAMTWKLSGQSGPGLGMVQIVCAINPYFMVFPAAIANVWGRIMGTLPWAWCIGSHLALSAGLMMWSSLILRRRARREGESSGGAVDPNLAPVPAISYPPPLPQSAVSGEAATAIPLAYARPIPSTKNSRAPRDVTDNPILWREIRRPLMARRWQRITGVCISLLLLGTVYLLFWANGDLKDADANGGWACVFNFLIAGIVLVISSTAISQEKESDTWTLLLATPVSGTTIVWGKAFGIVRRLMWPMALVAGHFLVFALFHVISFSAAFLTIWIIISFNTIWIATGVYFSLRFSKTTFAVIANLMLAIAAYLFVWGALAVLGQLDDVGSPQYPPPVDPQWTSAGAIAFLVAGAGWWLFALARSVLKARGAFGQLMIATLVFVVSVANFAARFDWIRYDRLYTQSGWFTPYYFFVQIRWRHYRGAEIWFPGTYYHTYDWFTSCSIVFGIGLLHLLLSWVVLSMTSWKFSALVGRAPQRKHLSPTDRAMPARRGPITTAAM